MSGFDCAFEQITFGSAEMSPASDSGADALKVGVVRGNWRMKPKYFPNTAIVFQFRYRCLLGENLI